MKEWFGDTDRVRKVYDGMIPLTAGDIAETLVDRQLAGSRKHR
jgi:hypothetical protein